MATDVGMVLPLLTWLKCNTNKENTGLKAFLQCSVLISLRTLVKYLVGGWAYKIATLYNHFSVTKEVDLFSRVSVPVLLEDYSMCMYR